MTGHLLRMVWPITDNTQGLPDLLDVACPEVAALAIQAHARITGAVRFTVCRSIDVPGSGRTTEFWATVMLLHRCNHRCERCGQLLTSMERHHRIRRRDGGDRLSNLLALHPRCHAYITEHPEEAKANGWIVSALGTTGPDEAPVRIDGTLWLLRDDGTKTPCP
jgi:hypothetical protein